MTDPLMVAETPYYQIIEMSKTEINPQYRNRTPSVFQRINPILSATHFYERYKRLNLLYYQQIMDTKDFEIFINFVGEESIGVRESHFEVFYPED